MKVADYIAKFLSTYGIEDVFLIDGAAAAALIVAVSENSDLKYHCPLHEQAGAFAIDGYYKASHKMSVMIATSGPAGQNLCNGIAASWYDSVPAIYLTGNINSRFMKPSETIRQHGFQEHDVVTMVRGFTKYAVQVRNPVNIKYELEKAFYYAKNGRPGPVLLDIPMDIQKAEINEEELPSYTVENTYHEKYDMGKIVDLVMSAQRPMMLIGGGVWLAGANEELRQLIAFLDIPFCVTWNMVDFNDVNDPLYAGRVGTFGGDGRNFAIQNCDLLLSIGSRISGRICGGMIDTFARGAKKIIVDIDAEELKYQQVKGDINIAMDAKEFISDLSSALKSGNWPTISMEFYELNQAWKSRCVEWRNKYRVCKPEYYEQKNSVNPYVFIKELSKHLDDDAIIAVDCGGNLVITCQGYEAKVGQRLFSNNGNSSLGYSLPASIGAAVACPGRQIICITGDGGMNFNIQELQTIRSKNLPIKIFVFSNNAFGITKAFRDTNFNSNYAGCDPEHGVVMPNFCRVAGAYDIGTWKINIHEDLYTLSGVLEEDGPVVCDVNMVGFYDYAPKLGWGVPIEDQYPFLPRDEFISNMIIPPIVGWEDPQYPGKK